MNTTNTEKEEKEEKEENELLNYTVSRRYETSPHEHPTKCPPCVRVSVYIP